MELTLQAIPSGYLSRKYAGAQNNVKFFEGDFSCLDLDKRFDIVNAFDVVYHIVDDELFMKFVENLCRHLKHGGFLFITDTFRQDYRDEITYVKFRPLNAHRTVLQENGVEIISSSNVFDIKLAVYWKTKK
jgi:SAM-dependent methyltransferase